jgi:amidase
VLEVAVDAMAGAGARVVQGWPEGLDPVQDFETFGRHLRAFISAGGPTADGEDPVALRGEPARRAARTAWSRHFRDVDVFVCPVAPTAAFLHDDRPFEERTVQTTTGALPYERIPFWVAKATLSGLPAVSVPVGRTSAGLPVGLQVIGPHGEDDTVITFAERLAELLLLRPASPRSSR